MKAPDLIDLIGEVKEEFVQEAKEPRTHLLPRIIKGCSLVAACFLLMVGAMTVFPGAGGGTPSYSPISYGAPLLPLTTADCAEGITAQREITFDFSGYNQNQYYHQCDITDRYVLTNETDEDQTLTLIYPYAGALADLQNDNFSFTVDGTDVQAVLHASPYTGSYMGALGGPNPQDGSSNLRPLIGFDAYEALLSDGSYLNTAFDPLPSLEQGVIVYRMSDYIYSADETAQNPTLELSFRAGEDTTILCYGMNSISRDMEAGTFAYGAGGIEHRPNASPGFETPDDAYLIVLGADITDPVVQGYRDGGCSKGEELDDLKCTLTRYETTLRNILDELLAEYEIHYPVTSPYVDRDTFLSLTGELLYTEGPLSDEPVQRYNTGMVGDLFISTVYNSRILYFTFDVTIPAGDSISAEIRVPELASYHVPEQDGDPEGYHLATTLGSTLTFSQQVARITGFDSLELIDQNFSFDLPAGITETELSPDQSRYWLEFRRNTG